ncbi:MAG: spondin domain-containing protein [Ignavibacteriae bacterium]|nr:spondin domain-containing protein [Ignavibacteriota bacterium]MCB9217600.1 spondin domain-containing protein [Ignavibacteria bacterium]
MKKSLVLQVLPLLTAGLLVAGCSEDEVTEPTATTFTVTVENVSQDGTLATTRANGAVPLSPGAYAVYQGANPMFTVGQASDAGLEAIAEDGETAMTVATLQANSAVKGSGAFMATGGPILPGVPATFTVSAVPGDRLQIALMFVQSNDWFYAFSGEGLDLFNGSTPVSGDVTSSIALYDAGTEEDTAPGTGPDQKPAQDPNAINVGSADDNTAIRPASDDGFSIPANNSVIRVTITPAS